MPARQRPPSAARDLIPERPGLDGLRRDVDTVADLREAARIGLGPHTAVAVGSLA